MNPPTVRVYVNTRYTFCRPNLHLVHGHELYQDGIDSKTMLKMNEEMRVECPRFGHIKLDDGLIVLHRLQNALEIFFFFGDHLARVFEKEIISNASIFSFP